MHGFAHSHNRERKARKREGQYRVTAADRKRQAQIAQHGDDHRTEGLVTQDEEQIADGDDRQAAVQRYADHLEDDQEHQFRHQEHNGRNRQDFARVGREYRASGRVVPLPGRAVLEFGSDDENRRHDREDQKHHRHKTRRKVIAVVDMRVE